MPNTFFTSKTFQINSYSKNKSSTYQSFKQLNLTIPVQNI